MFRQQKTLKEPNRRLLVKLRPFTLVLAFSLLLPIALLAGSSIFYNRASIFGAPRFLAENWLYMALPQLLLGVLALTFVRALLRVGIVTLLVLDTLLVCFQVWIWRAVPGREGADAWMIYIPLWIAVLITAFVFAWVGARRERKL
jgi:ABC-type spermidine/putrescine transport system permease subunit I